MRRQLRILHILRAPVGGLFRHVLDLAREQAQRGHAVGLIADCSTGNALTNRQLRDVEQYLKLGIHRIKMARLPSLNDVSTIRQTRRLVDELDVDVLHGHGAKGGLFARLGIGGSQKARQRISHRSPEMTTGRERPANGQVHDKDGNATVTGWTNDDPQLTSQDRSALRIYTPHGGSLHYANNPLLGPVYLGMESILQRFTDGILFESVYAQRTYVEHVGNGNTLTRIVPNGLKQSDFVEVAVCENASEFVFIGELRDLKGVDVLLNAMKELGESSAARLAIVGEGPDKQDYMSLIDKLGIKSRVAFLGAMPAKDAFKLGHIVVMPSRAESLPYVALEAAAAGKPLIATHVGGVPEIVWGTKMKLVPPGDAEALAASMREMLEKPILRHDLAIELRDVVAKRFTVETMAGSILDFYSDLLNVSAVEANDQPDEQH